MHLMNPAGRRRVGAALAAAAVAASGLSVAAPALAKDVAPVDGALTAGDTVFPNVGNGGYDALHYDLDIAWTPVYDASVTNTANRFAQSTVEATATMTAKAEQPLRSFGMDFEGLTVDSVTVDGTPATWTRISDDDAIKHKLVVTPAAPVDGEFSVTVAYSGVPQPHIDADGSQEGWSPVVDGAMVLGQPVGMMTAYPHNNTPKDKATYDITLDVPSEITNAAGTGSAAAVSNGELVSRTVSEDGTRTTWDWKQKYPMASELTVIGIGKYDVLESTVTLSDGREIPEWSFVDSALSAANKTTINNRRTQFSTILQNLETFLGPYPGDSTGVIVDTVPSAINYALETQDRSFFPSASSVNGNTLIHEFVHQWYGNHVSPDDWNGLWMGEGMATWAPTYYNHKFGTGANPSDSYYTAWKNKAATNRDWLIPPSGITDSADLYSYQTYTRGAHAWEALRQYIGEDAYFELIREWMVQKGGTSQSVTALKEFAEEISGKDLDAFFDEWIYAPVKPNWPELTDVSVSSDATAPVDLGDKVTYTVDLVNNGRQATLSSKVALPLESLLVGATVDEDSLPTGVTLDGDSLLWTVPVTAPGANASTSFSVTITDASAAHELALTVKPLVLGGSCVTCEATVTVNPALLPVVETPEVDGTARVGSTVRAWIDRWERDVTVTYQWLADGQAIAGATSRSFTVPASLKGAELSVQVTGTKKAYAPSVLTSAPVKVAAGLIESAGTPRIKGKAVFGSTLTAVPGTWEEGVELSYQWLRDGADIAGATRATYVPTVADLGADIAVEVTGTKAGFTSVERVSAVVGPVKQATLPAGKVTLKGKAKAGKKLTAKVTGFGDAKRTYAWTVGGKKVGSKASLKVKKSWAGKKVTVTVTATKAGHVSAKATASKKVAKVKKAKKSKKR